MMSTEYDETAEMDPEAYLSAMQEQGRANAERFQSWMDQQLADADEANAERKQEHAEIDAAMWSIVDDQRAMNRRTAEPGDQ